MGSCQELDAPCGVGFVRGRRTKGTFAFLFEFTMIHSNLHAKTL